MKSWVMEAFKTGLFTPISLERGEFLLKGTEYMVVIRKNATLWKKKEIRGRGAPTRVPGDMTPAKWAAMSQPRYINCSFEEIFDSVPDYIRERMIYHLDILNRGGMAFEDNKRIRGLNSMLIAFDELMDFGDK